MDQIKGLLTCKPENTPHAGEVRKYVVTYPISKRTDKPWTKISNSNGDDGLPYTVISVAKTKFESDLGHVSFNLVIEPALVQKYSDRVSPEGHPDEMSQNAPPTSQKAPVGHFNQLPHQSSQNSPRRVEHLSKDDYWTIKDQRDREREARMVAQQPRIERQHSQEMGVRLATVFPDLVCDGPGIFNWGKLHSLINQFQRDIGYVQPETKGSQ